MTVKNITWSTFDTICITFSENLNSSEVANLNKFVICEETDRLITSYRNYISSVSIEENKIYLKFNHSNAQTFHELPGEIYVEYDPEATDNTSLISSDGSIVDHFYEKVPPRDVLTSNIYISNKILDSDVSNINSLLKKALYNKIYISPTDDVITLAVKTDKGSFSTTSSAANTSSGSSITFSGNRTAINDGIESLALTLKKSDIKSEFNENENIINTINVKIKIGDSVTTSKIYILSEDVKDSSVFMNNNECNYINSVKNITSSDFTYSYYTDTKVIDAEKDLSLGRNDQMCWAGTASNMLTWAGYTTNVANQGLETEDAVFKEFWTNFYDEGGNISKGITWFMNGSGKESLSLQNTDSGNYVGYVARELYEQRDETSLFWLPFAQAVLSGSAVGISVSGSSLHAQTCWGISFDTSKSPNDPTWLTGLYLTDSDDSKNVSNPSDDLFYVGLEWMSSYNCYRFIEDSSYRYSSSTYWSGDFVSLARKNSLQESLADGRLTVDDLVTQRTTVAANTVFTNQTTATGEILTVLSGGSTISQSIASGGREIVSKGGVAQKTTIQPGGILYVAGKASQSVASNTADDDGSVYVLKGGSALETRLLGGTQYISSGGFASKTSIITGVETVAHGGMAESTTVSQGDLAVYGSALKATVKQGGSITVYASGKTSGTTVQSKGYEAVMQGGKAQATRVLDGGLQDIMTGGTASATRIDSGGSQWIAGSAVKTVVSGGGMAETASKAVLSSLTVKSGGSCRLGEQGRIAGLSLTGGSMVLGSKTTVSKAVVKGNATLLLTQKTSLGGSNSFTKTTVSAQGKSPSFALSKKSTLTLGTNVVMSQIAVAASSAGLLLTGKNNTISSLSTNAATTITYDITALAAKGNTRMLTLSQKANTSKTKTILKTAKTQTIGVYELSKNSIQGKNQQYTIAVDGKNVGTAKLNGDSLTKNGMTYTLKSTDSNTVVNLDISMRAGKMLKGTAKGENLKGAANSDIFYGGKGNDTLAGANGRDVAVYDTGNWGKDVINKTSGTMTLLFTGMTAKDVTQKKSGNTLVVSKKSNAKQTITVKSWDDATHNLVFTNDTKKYTTYLKAASPTKKQTEDARNEIWKKAGLAKA